MEENTNVMLFEVSNTIATTKVVMECGELNLEEAHDIVYSAKKQPTKCFPKPVSLIKSRIMMRELINIGDEAEIIGDN